MVRRLAGFQSTHLALVYIGDRIGCKSLYPWPAFTQVQLILVSVVAKKLCTSYIYVPIVYILRSCLQSSSCSMEAVGCRNRDCCPRIEWFPGIDGSFVLGPSDSQELLSFRFLSTVSSAVSIEALKQVSRFPTKSLYPGSLNTVFIPLQI